MRKTITSPAVLILIVAFFVIVLINVLDLPQTYLGWSTANTTLWLALIFGIVFVVYLAVPKKKPPTTNEEIRDKYE